MRLTLEEAAASVPDGATVALGGVRLQRRPMALVRALAEAGRRDLRVVAFLGSLDVELLLAAGCVAELHSPGVSLDAAGLAPRYRAARQTGEPRFVEWSEGLMLTALDASTRGVPSLPAWMGLGSDLPDVNPWLRTGSDPFDDTPVMNVRALDVDVALIHVPGVDPAGNLYVEGDLGADGLLARAARRTIASFEGRRDREPLTAAISRIWIEDVVEAPRGAWPCGCHPAYGADLATARRWAKEGASAGVELLAP
ncbi:MAG: coenzyme transferase [Solirubrobacterales bacterium]|nr:coenzyme transferase [Solirubrobacterales bacterium]